MRTKQRLALTVLAGAVFATSSTTAMAQQTVSQGISVPRRAGGAERTVDVEAGVSASYDSNPLRTSTAQAAALGLMREDVVVTPSLNIGISVPSGRNTVTLGGVVAYDFNMRNRLRNGERIALTGGLSTDLRRCETSIDASVSRARSDAGNFSGTPATVRALIRNIETTTEVGGQLSCGGAVGLRPFVGVNYGRGRNTQTLRRLSDYNLVSYGGGIAYSQPSIGEIGLIGSIDETRYPVRPDNSLALGQPRFSARSLGIFFNRESARTLQARLRLNYTDVDPGVAAAAYRGLSGEGAVRFVPGGRFVIEAKAARAANASLTFNVDYVLETALSLGLDAPLSPKLGFSAKLDHRDRVYYGGVLTVANPLLNDQVSVISGGVSYKVSHRLALNLLTAYDWRRANDAFYDYDSARVTISARMGL